MKDPKYLHISDQELLEMYHQSRDNRWLAVLLERYTLLLFGVCWKYLKDEEDAKETVQQIQVKVLDEVDRHKIEYFKSWLYTVAVNTCNALLRKRQKLFLEIREYDHVIVDPTDAEVDLEKDLKIALIPDALKELKQPQQDCLRMFYLEEKNYREIAHQTNTSIKQVKSNIQNGKRNLRLILIKKLSNQ